MNDVVFLLVTVGAFGLLGLFVRGCEKLLREASVEVTTASALGEEPR